MLRLTASDGSLTVQDDMTVNVQEAPEVGTPGEGGDQGNDGNCSQKCGFGAALALILLCISGLRRGLVWGSTHQGADVPGAKTSPR